ncbi:hypothetical protein CS022_06255 [Veronia nyctiphanis]|uniref:UPF0208 membrane protein CS022_06255 n=1 Tax=Veronia nyctiphanis TaxID=1278244 RepID=A0A4Q0YT58_9GAMM|nr:terminus macrodomain insulation protein YfbV [Veronia nyctiphanis]RXJ73895.1 hypothetical protein CS022_06255 [Veronia nyctiphanis]
MSNKSMWNSLRDGQRYIEEWPLRKELAPMFPENRIIKATRFAIRVMPPVAVICILMQMAFHNHSGLPQAMIIALFALSLPLQGLWWLGRRRDTQLPPALAGWYRDLHDKIVSEGGAVQPIKSRPRYKELAVTLNKAFKQLDKGALDRWF